VATHNVFQGHQTLRRLAAGAVVRVAEIIGEDRGNCARQHHPRGCPAGLVDRPCELRAMTRPA